MALTQEQIETAADALQQAEMNRAPIAALTDTYADIQTTDAYAVQLALIRRWLDGGARATGWKVGLTSVAMQRLLGVSEPDFGHLLAGMLVPDGGAITCSDFIWPRVEAEIAFQLKGRLQGPGVTADDVLAATEYLIPALEIVDSRIRDWKIKLADTIADNASCGRFVLGAARVPPGDFDLRLVGMNFSVDGELASTATAAAVLGNPAGAVAWLANTLAGFGQTLEAGQVVMPGSLIAAVDAKPGMTFRADFDRLGSVSVRVV